MKPPFCVVDSVYTFVRMKPSETAHKANAENVGMKLSTSALRFLDRMQKAENFFLSTVEARANRDAMSELQDHILVNCGQIVGD